MQHLGLHIGIAKSLSLNGCNNLYCYPFALSGRNFLDYLLSASKESDYCLLEDWAFFLGFRTQSRRMEEKDSSNVSGDVSLLSETSVTLQRLPYCDHCLVYESPLACLIVLMYYSTASDIDMLWMMVCFVDSHSIISPLIAKLMNFYPSISCLIP